MLHFAKKVQSGLFQTFNASKPFSGSWKTEYGMCEERVPSGASPVVVPTTIADTHDYTKIIEFAINSKLYYLSSGTDGLRPTGRTCHWSPLRSCSQAEMISSSTGTRTLTCLIRHLFRNAGQGRMIPIGKYPLLNGQSFFIALTRANR